MAVEAHALAHVSGLESPHLKCFNATDPFRKAFLTVNLQTPISRRRLVSSTAVAAAALVAGSHLSMTPVLADDKIVVTCTVGMIADAVRIIGGDRVDVKGLMGPGIDPHLYKPSAGDIKSLGKADIIFYGGLHLEGRMVDTFEKIHKSGTPTIPVSESIPEDKLHASADFGGAFDPHVWFDVSIWMIAVETIARELAERFPDHADTFETNAAAYLEELDALDTYVQDQVNTLPEKQRVLITAHDAFGYFGTRYGFEVKGLQGINTANEAGAGDVQDLAQFIVDNEIRAIFVESSVPYSTIEAVQKASQAKGWDVQIGGELFSDALGNADSPEGTYIGMVTFNVDTIVGALLPDDAA